MKFSFLKQVYENKILYWVSETLNAQASYPDERGLSIHYKKKEKKVFEKKSVINRKCFQRLQVGPRAAGVHQVSEGDHEQQGRAAEPVRPQGGADPAGQVHLPHHPPRHARGSQADGRRVPRPPGRP